MKNTPFVVAVYAFLLSSTAHAAIVETTITFDTLTSGNSYIENGYLFQGFMEKSPGSSFPTRPISRIYGINPITITRLDGLPFTLTSFDVAYRSSSDTDWRIDNQAGSGISITRDGHFNSTQFWTVPVTNKLSLIINDPAARNTIYYEFDNFVFKSNSPIPIPPALWLFGSGLLGLVGIARRKKVH